MYYRYIYFFIVLQEADLGMYYDDVISYDTFETKKYIIMFYIECGFCQQICIVGTFEVQI